MKNYLCIIACIITFVSCNNNELEAKQDKKVLHESQLILNLQSFNSQLVYNPDTRGWRDWIIVAYEDAKGAYRGGRVGLRIGAMFGGHGATIGAVAGGLIVGAAASYGVWPRSESKCIQIQELYDNQMVMLQAANSISNDELRKIKYDADVNIDLPAKYTYLEDVGALHNGALQVASYKTLTRSSSDINSGGEAFNNLLIKCVEEKTGEIDLTSINNTALEIVKNKEFKSNYQAIVYDAITNVGLPNDLHATNSPEIEDEFSPIGDMIMELFKDAYTKYPEKIEDYDFLVNEYIKIIEASNELTDAEKEAIYTGFSVAAYTARYWDQESKVN